MKKKGGCESGFFNQSESDHGTDTHQIGLGADATASNHSAEAGPRFMRSVMGVLGSVMEGEIEIIRCPGTAPGLHPKVVGAASDILPMPQTLFGMDDSSRFLLSRRS